MELKLGAIVALRERPTLGWTVSFIEGKKVYCYRHDDDWYSSIVVDASLLMEPEIVNNSTYTRVIRSF
jgi:hypothetical protein